MKKLFITIIAILIIVSVFAPSIVPTNAPTNAPTEFYFEDEVYIDDIPFDTKAIADSARL